MLIILTSVAWRFFVPTPDFETPTVTESVAVPEHLQRKEGFYTFLLVGSDLGGGNADTIMVVGYDTIGQRVSLLSIPRDTMVYRDWSKFPKINAALSKGLDVLENEVSTLLGIPIDFSLHVTLDGFVRLVDEIGGIEYDVPQRMYHDDEGGFIIDLHAGIQTLDGRHTLELVRYRGYNNADIGRTQTQQGVLKALALKALSFDSLGKIQPFIEIFQQEVKTDLSLSDMLWFAQSTLQSENLVMETATLEGRGDASINGYSWCFELDDLATLAMVNSMVSPFVMDRTLEDLSLRNGN
ncbi:MAG: LCP family protein [Eubacteriales bacterium]